VFALVSAEEGSLTKAFAHDAVPGRLVLGVEVLFDEGCDVLFNGVELGSLARSTSTPGVQASCTRKVMCRWTHPNGTADCFCLHVVCEIHTLDGDALLHFHLSIHKSGLSLPQHWASGCACDQPPPASDAAVIREQQSFPVQFLFELKRGSCSGSQLRRLGWRMPSSTCFHAVTQCSADEKQRMSILISSFLHLQSIGVSTMHGHTQDACSDILACKTQQHTYPDISGHTGGRQIQLCFHASTPPCTWY
jgi:hypothetical protein